MTKRNYASLFIGLFLFSCASHAQIINTIAGCNDTALGDGGPAIAAGLFQPFSVAVDSANNIYISDFGNSRIRKVNAAGIITTIAGGLPGFSGDNGPATAAKLNHPAGIKLDAAGNLYIVDCWNSCVRKINTAGIITTIAGIGNMPGYGGDNGPATLAQFNYPNDIAFDKNGNIYISCAGDDHIRKVDTSGIITTIAGNFVWGFSGDGGPATAAAMRGPSGIAIDTSGNIYFADDYNNRIREINTMGIINTIAGTGIGSYNGDSIQATAANIDTAAGIALDTKGNLYIADALNERIRMVNLASGIISTIAGNGGRGFSGDGGPAANAELNIPYGVTIDASGDVYISDSYNNRIRNVTQPTTAPVINTQKDNLTIYPNPCYGSFTMHFTSGITQRTQVTITDLSGREIKEFSASTNTDIDVPTDMPACVYLLSAVTSSGVLREKLVVMK